MPRRVTNTIPQQLSASEILSGLFIAESGYTTDMRSTTEDLVTKRDMRLYYFSSGKGMVGMAGRSHPVQQHDVIFQPQLEKMSVTLNPSVPAEVWWIDFYGPAVPYLLKLLSVSASRPLISGIYEPRFFSELKGIVTHYDALSEADKLHLTSGLYKLFAILLDFGTNSQWITVPHDDSAILFTGPWTAWPSPFGGAHEEYYTATPKAYAEFNFYGTGIKWLGTLNFDCGIADVIIDGHFVTQVDAYNPVRLSKQLLYVNTKLNFGHHIIKIFCTGNKNDKASNCDVVVESFQYLSSNNTPGGEADLSSASSQVVRRAVELMNSGMSDMNVDRLAQALGVNRSYLTTRFTGEIGVSPSQYLTRLRLLAAKRMLAETDYAVGKIATLVGYSDVFYFSRIFRQSENMTPTQYRKLNQKQ